jgi:hypothetical protein
MGAEFAAGCSAGELTIPAHPNSIGSRFHLSFLPSFCRFGYSMSVKCMRSCEFQKNSADPGPLRSACWERNDRYTRCARPAEPESVGKTFIGPTPGRARGLALPGATIFTPTGFRSGLRQDWHRRCEVSFSCAPQKRDWPWALTNSCGQSRFRIATCRVHRKVVLCCGSRLAEVQSSGRYFDAQPQDRRIM